MPNSQFVDFKVVKSAVTMEQVLEHYCLLDSLNRSGDSLSGPCPIHGGTNPTQFRVSLSKNCWNCFSDCKGGGNVLDFVARMDGISIRSAAVRLAEWFNLPNAKPAQRQARSDAKPKPRTKSATTIEVTFNKPLGFQLKELDFQHPYLAERGIPLETAVEFGLGFCSKGMLKDHIAIPIDNTDGKLVAYAGRWPGDPPEDSPKYKLPPGFKKSSELYHLDRALKEPPEEPWIVVEGFFDCIHLWQAGFRKVVALMGSTMSEQQEELLRRHTDRDSRIIVLMDEDDAGREGRENIVVRLARFAFVKAPVFEQEDTQPDHLSAEELSAILT